MRKILFTLFCLFALATGGFATENKSTSQQEKGLLQTQNRIFGIYGSIASCTPTGNLREYFGPYVLAGLALDFPTYVQNLYVRGEAKGGFIKGNGTASGDKYATLHQAVIVYYEIGTPLAGLVLRPHLGISNTTVYLYEEFSLEALDIFATSENEFGLLAGLEPAFIRKRLCVGVPVRIDYVLSSPNPFVSFSVSLTAGILF